MNKISEQDSESIGIMYLSGKTSPFIANHFNVTVASVCRHLKLRGIKTRPMHEIKRTYSLNDKYFEAIDSHEKAQILGMLYADGNVSSQNNSMEITLQPIDESYLIHIKKCLNFGGPLRYYKRKDGREYVRLTVSSLKMHKNLVSLGMIPKKSLILEFPKKIPKDYLSSFVLGYHEGDGSINVWKKESSGLDSNLKFCVTHQFGVALKTLLWEELSVNSCLHLSKIYREGKFVNMYTLGVSGNQQVRKVCEWMYSNASFKMKRKYDDYLYLLSHYDSEGNVIKDEGWKERRQKRCEETFKRNGTRPGVKATRWATFISSSGTVYNTNNLTRFAREHGLAPSETYNMIDGVRKTPHRGWRPATPSEIDSARAAGTLIERIY